MSAEDSLPRAEELLARLEDGARAKLEATEDPDEAIKILSGAGGDREGRSRPSSSGRGGRRSGDRRPRSCGSSSRAYLAELALTPELHGQAESVRYSIAVGGKRVRPVICLATARRRAPSRPGAARGRGGAGARAHVLARPRRPARAGRRRGAARPSVDLGAVRRGGRDPRGRRAARRGVPARALVPDAGGRARARAGDARHDRRPVPGHHRRRRRISRRCTG